MMYREIDHTADIAFEIVNDTFLGLLEDILKIIHDTYKVENINCNIAKVQEYDIKENEDGVFDIVNDWIAAIELGYFPVKIEKDKKYKTTFCSYSKIEGETFKALTYHNLKIEKKANKLSIKVVFDI
jgi:SHS2 domain-containing protein